MSSPAGPSRPRLRTAPPADHEADSHALVARLSLQDIDDLQSQTAPQPGTPRSDREVALALFAQDARSSIVFQRDRALAARLQAEESARVGVVDANPPTFLRHPSVVARPAQVVPRPAQPQDAPAAAPRQNATRVNPTPSVFGWVSEILSSIFKAAPGESRPTSTAQPTPARVPPRATGHNCVACQDPIIGAEVRAPCGHFYDIGCITDLYQAATKDESLFPPRCCRTPILFSHVKPHLSADLIKLFDEKTLEFGTLKRVYCASPACSRFLGPQREGWFTSTLICPANNCTTRTCSGCKAAVEYGFGRHTCKTSQEDQAVLNLSRASGWAQCPGCSQMIELNMGCFHMTCRCKTEFCYVCKATWKTCGCPQWDENRLIAAAERRVDAQLAAARHAPPVHVAAAPPRQPAVRPVPNAPPPVRQVPAPQPPAPRPAAAAIPETRRTIPGYPNPEVLRTVPEQRTQNYVFGTSSSSTHSNPAPAAPPIHRHSSNLSHIPYASLLSTRSGPAPAAPPIHRHSSNLSSTVTRPQPTSPPPPASGTSSSSMRFSPAPATPPNRRHSSNLNSIVPRPQSIPPASPASPARRPSTAGLRAQMIRKAMEELRVNHDCQHTKWVYRRGGGHCETCHHFLDKYLFRCNGCQILACNRCRRNRL